MEDEWPLPAPTEESAEFWRAAAAHELKLQRCQDCGRYQHYPRLVCSHCQHQRLVWEPVSGRGTVYSFTTVHRPPTMAFAPHTPYVVALVDLDESVRMMTWIVGSPEDSIAIGARVAVEFLDIAEGVSLPVFRLSEAMPGSRGDVT